MRVSAVFLKFLPAGGIRAPPAIDLRPRTVGILFEGIAGYVSEARGI
jgi:hypothetical protein